MRGPFVHYACTLSENGQQGGGDGDVVVFAFIAVSSYKSIYSSVCE